MKARQFGPLVGLEVATALSGTGNGISTVVLPWLVLERTGMATAAALVAAAAAIPTVFAALAAGTLVDRVGRRRSSIGSDVLSALSVAAIPIIDHVMGLNLGWITVLAVIGAVFDPAGVTARETMLPQAARAAGLRLERVNGFHEAVWGVAFIIGPGVAGVMVAAVGAAATLWATAGAFALSAVVIAIIPIPAGAKPEPTTVSFWADTVAGLQFVGRDKVLLAVGVFNAMLAGTYLPIEGVLLPVYFTEQHAPQRLGLLIVTMSVGWVIGSLLYGAVGHRLPRRALFVSSAIGTAIFLLPLAFLPPYPVMLLAGALSGLLYGPIEPMLNLAVQHRSPEHMRGRAVGLVSTFATAAAPLGYLIAGPLVDAAGLQPAFFVMTGAILVAAVATAFIKPLKVLDTMDGHPGL